MFTGYLYKYKAFIYGPSTFSQETKLFFAKSLYRVYITDLFEAHIPLFCTFLCCETLDVQSIGVFLLILPSVTVMHAHIYTIQASGAKRYCSPSFRVSVNIVTSLQVSVPLLVLVAWLRFWVLFFSFRRPARNARTPPFSESLNFSGESLYPLLIHLPFMFHMINSTIC